MIQARNTTSKVLTAIKAGIWDGLSENETSQTLALKVISAYGIILVTPVSPLVAAGITVIGLKTFCTGTYYLGSSIFSQFYQHLASPAPEEKKFQTLQLHY